MGGFAVAALVLATSLVGDVQADPAADALAKLNEVDKMILGASATIPLYQKPTYLAIKDNIGNARDNPSLDSPTYNIEQWGLKTG